MLQSRKCEGYEGGDCECGGDGGDGKGDGGDDDDGGGGGDGDDGGDGEGASIADDRIYRRITTRVLVLVMTTLTVITVSMQ